MHITKRTMVVVEADWSNLSDKRDSTLYACLNFVCTELRKIMNIFQMICQSSRQHTLRARSTLIPAAEGIQQRTNATFLRRRLSPVLVLPLIDWPSPVPTRRRGSQQISKGPDQRREVLLPRLCGRRRLRCGSSPLAARR